jgi:hypothetical protein
VGPPDEDVELLRHLSYKFLKPSIDSLAENKKDLNDPIVPSEPKILKIRKVKRDDNDELSQDPEVCKRSVVYDDDEESDKKKKKVSLKRKRVEENVKSKRVLVDFGDWSSDVCSSDLFSNVFSCCQVGPPDEDVELLRHLSHKLLKHSIDALVENEENI